MVKRTLEYFRPTDKKRTLLYARYLESCPDSVVQQSIAWCKVIESMGRDECILFIAKKNSAIVGVLPAYLYPCPLGNVLTSVPLPGPLGGVATDQKEKEAQRVYDDLLRAMTTYARARQCITTTVITSPFRNDSATYRSVFRPDYTLEKFTQYIDLTRPLHFSHGIRSNVSRAKRAGMRIGESNDRSFIEQWWHIHTQRMRELSADPLPLKLLLAIHASMVPRNAKFFYVFLHNKLIGGCCYIFHRDIIDVFMLSCDSAYRNLSPCTFLTDHTIHWARTKGFRIYNFQSSKKKGDGVYQFKAQWGTSDAPYYFVTKKLKPVHTLLGCALSRVEQAYKWHYVAPFSLWHR